MKMVNAMAQLTLATWLTQELKKRDMSVRAFSKASGIGHTTLNNILNPDDNDTHYPSVDVLIRLAAFTGTDVCTLLAMISPTLTNTDPSVTVLAQRIKRLGKAKRDFVESYIIGQLLNPTEDDAEV